MIVTVNDVLRITDGTLIGGIDEDTRKGLLDYEIHDIVFDSRAAKENSLFVAIPGENVDPHKFVAQVAEKTKAILVEQGEEDIIAKADIQSLPEGVAYIKVNNSLDALQALGAYYRDFYKGTVVGVTGSVGKTTTREMITQALSSNVDTYSTTGNMNSQIGVPITISHMLDNPSEAAVIEMGISEPGGMDRLAKIVRPDIAVVTIIGQAHIEFLGTKEGIRHEKLRITSQMDENGVIFLNADDPLLFEMKDKMDVKTFTYGTNTEADYRAEDIVYENGYNTYTYVHNNDRILVNLSMLGKHNILNSLAAMAVADHMGLDLMKAAKSFEDFHGMRQKTIKSEKGYTIIDDSYNASPDSMKAALNVLRDSDISGKRIAVLGDMFELGPNTRSYHREVGDYIAALKFGDGKTVLDELITIGDFSTEISDGASENSDISIHHFDNKCAAAEYIKSILKPGDTITLKASNGMKFWEIVDKLK